MVGIGSGYGQWFIRMLWSSGERAVISKHLPWGICRRKEGVTYKGKESSCFHSLNFLRGKSGTKAD